MFLYMLPVKHLLSPDYKSLNSKIPNFSSSVVYQRSGKHLKFKVSALKIVPAHKISKEILFKMVYKKNNLILIKIIKKKQKY